MRGRSVLRENVVGETLAPSICQVINMLGTAGRRIVMITIHHNLENILNAKTFLNIYSIECIS